MKYLKSYIIAVSMVLVFSLSAFAGMGTVIVLGALIAPIVGGLTVGLLAFPPAIPYVAGAVLMGAVGNSVVFSKPSASTGYKPVVTSAGNIKKPSDPIWIELDDKIPTVKTQKIDEVIPFQVVKNISKGNKNAYPLLDAALHVLSGADAPGVVAGGNYSVGQTVSAGGQLSIITEKWVTNVPWANVSPPFLYINGHPTIYNLPITGFTVFTGDYSSQPYGFRYYTSYVVYGCAPTTQSVVDATPAQFVGKIKTAPLDLTVKPDYHTEIDKMLQDPSYLPVFNDESGLPYAPSPSAMTVDAVNAAIPAAVAIVTAAASTAATTAAAATAAATATAAQTAATTAAATATTAATAAGSAMTLYNAAATASTAAAAAAAAAGGTDAALNTAAANAAAAVAAAGSAAGAANGIAATTAAAAGAAGAAAGAAGTAAGNAAAAAAATAAEDAKNAAQTSAGIPAAPVRKTIDFEPLENLNGVLQNTYPFNLPSSISSYFSAFSAEGGGAAPVFDLPLPLGQTIHVDLSFFDGLATMIRYLVGLSVSGGILFYIIHFFRGIS